MIQLRNLCVGYGGQSVLAGVDLDFRPGEILVLAGPNGCGKTTLIRTVLGLQPALAGKILVDGRLAEELSPREMAQKAAYLAQSRPVPSITAERMVLHGRFPYLSYPRRYRPEDKAAARAALDRVGAVELEQRLMPQLSGGERQKVWLAMALAQDTETVFLDEPTTYLDARHQLEMMEIARWLAQQGKAVVMVLHDLCLALRGADRSAILADGCLQQVGTPEELLNSGCIDRVFGVALRRTGTESGWRYYYE